MLLVFVAGLGAAQQTGSDGGPAVSDVVVQAARPEAVARIDRNVYDISNDPQAKGAPLLDVLGKLPSITVTPSGGLRLLGASGVTVMIDGKPVANAEIKLGVMTGADVDKVEVMTNPSAQFAAQGTAGIINIVTRKRYDDGWSGSATAKVETDGDVEVVLAPTRAFGKWSIGGTLTAGRTAGRSEGDRRRVLDGDGGSEVRTEMQSSESTGQRVWADMKVTYRPSERRLLTLSAEAYASDQDQDGRHDLASTDPTFPAYVERWRRDSGYDDAKLGLTYEWTGRREGETLTLDGTVERWRWRSDEAFSDVFTLRERRFGTRRDDVDHEAAVKLDYARPFGADKLLTIGASWSRTDEDIETGFSNPADDGDLGPSFDRRLSGRRDVAAVYGTLQFPLGRWTALPGLRLEAQDLALSSAGGPIRDNDTGLFPSLHLSRPVTKTLGLKLSYSRRIERPDLGTLDPSIAYGGSTSASVGNPDLKPAITQSYEARFDYKRKAHGLNLTLYDRETEGTWSSLARLSPEGVLVSTTVNAGRNVDRGAETSLRGPLATRWTYAATVNLFQRETPSLEGELLRGRKAISYGGNIQLNYKAPARGEREGDQLQLSLRYIGPDRGLQSRFSGFVYADLTLRHALTPRVSAVLVVSDLFDSVHPTWRTYGDGFVEQSRSWQAAPRARLSLTYKLGGSTS